MVKHRACQFFDSGGERVPSLCEEGTSRRTWEVARLSLSRGAGRLAKIRTLQLATARRGRPFVADNRRVARIASVPDLGCCVKRPLQACETSSICLYVGRRTATKGVVTLQCRRWMFCQLMLRLLLLLRHRLLLFFVASGTSTA